MCLTSDKFSRYEEIVQGEEVDCSKLVEVFSECWAYLYSVEVDHEMVLLFSIEAYHPTYCSLILSQDKVPIVTKQTTTEIIKKYQESYCGDFDMSKKLIENINNKKNYLAPYMSKNSMMVPLEGESKGNVSYINISLLNNIAPYDTGETVFTFCNLLNIVLPRNYRSAKKRVLNCFEHYAAYYTSLAILNSEEDSNVPFKNWIGKMIDSATQEKLIREAKNKVNRNQLMSIKLIHELEKVKPKRIAMDILDGYYEML